MDYTFEYGSDYFTILLILRILYFSTERIIAYFTKRFIMKYEQINVRF